MTADLGVTPGGLLDQALGLQDPHERAHHLHHRQEDRHDPLGGGERVDPQVGGGRGDEVDAQDPQGGGGRPGGVPVPGSHKLR